MSDRAADRTLVLGLGNPIMGDDGLGLAILARLRAGWLLPPEVELVDGGTVLDAINVGQDPGAIVVLERADLPRYFSHKLSPHQIDLREVLALAELRGTLPPDVAALGAQPAQVELMAELSPILARRVEAIAELAVARLERWGHRCAGVAEVASA